MLSWPGFEPKMSLEEGGCPIRLATTLQSHVNYLLKYNKNSVNKYVIRF